MKILKTVTVLAISGIIATVAIQAQPFGGKGNRDNGMMQERMEMMQLMRDKHQEMRAIFEQLDLSDTQFKGMLSKVR